VGAGPSGGRRVRRRDLHHRRLHGDADG
jgi:hypothetical protein